MSYSMYFINIIMQMKEIVGRLYSKHYHFSFLPHTGTCTCTGNIVTLFKSKNRTHIC